MKHHLRLLALALAALPAQAAPRSDPPPGEYRIEAGRVDRGTFLGWRLYHSACFGCHGVDGLGTDVAPNLLQRVQAMTPRDFVAKVLTSYRLTAPTGISNAETRAAEREALIEEVLRRERSARGALLMPAWEGDPNVRPHVLDLFAYLTARAEGKLGPGRPRVAR